MERNTYIPVEALGLTEETSQEVKQRTQKTGEWEHYTPEFVRDKSKEIDVNDFIKQAGIVARNFENSRLSQVEGTIKLKGDLPISIVGMGDLHIGSVSCNLKEVQRKFKEIEDTPNMYCVLMSNLIENAIPSQFPSNMLNANLTPDKQVLVMRNIVESLNAKGKILGAVTSPCHEGWTWKHTGQDINTLIYGFKERNFPVLQNGGKLTIKFDKQKYTGYLYHQVGPFDSNFNKTHALKQLNRLNLRMNADFIFGAHRHVASSEVVYEGTGVDRRLTAYIRTGSEKGTGNIHDDFAVGKLGKTGEPTGSMLHLMGNKFGMMTNTDFDMGVLCHQNLYIGEIIKRENKKGV
jgi:hypothetical protein